jgi:hypothetical protein
MMADLTDPITPLPDAVERAFTELRRLAGSPSDQAMYFLGLITAATDTAVAGYEHDDEVSLRIGLRLQLSYIGAAVLTNADQS